jgi:hypothetical protein
MGESINTMRIPKINEKIPGTRVIKFFEKPERLIGVTSLFLKNFT